MSIAVKLRRGEVLHARVSRIGQISISGHRVEQLVIDRRRQNYCQSALQHCQFRAHRFAVLRELETRLHGLLDGFRIGDQFRTVLPNAFIGFALVAQLRQRQPRTHPVRRPLARATSANDKASAAVNLGAAATRAPLCCTTAKAASISGTLYSLTMALHVSDTIEGEPAHQAGESGEGNRKADTRIEPDRNPAAGQQQATQMLADHQARPLSESTSR